MALLAVSAFVFSSGKTEAGLSGAIDYAASVDQRVIANRYFDIQILVDGRPLEEYQARGKSYVEAIAGAEYEVRVRNPLPYRVAVALSVDGLNTIDAQHTTAWNASKWVIEPYGTISINGWQMSSVRARRFYFTSERDSYGAKLGQTSNLGVVTAVFFRERPQYPVRITPRRGLLTQSIVRTDVESRKLQRPAVASLRERTQTTRRQTVCAKGTDHA